jgi:hypothetical protein
VDDGENISYKFFLQGICACVCVLSLEMKSPKETGRKKPKKKQKSLKIISQAVAFATAEREHKNVCDFMKLRNHSLVAS